MSGWRKCDTCRKVRATDEFDGGASTCRSCLAAPAPKARRTAAATVVRKAAPRPAEPSGPRAPLLGSVGSGDLEVRERRARRAAQDALAELYPQEYALLLRDARAAEGLRPLSVAEAPEAPEAPEPDEG